MTRLPGRWSRVTPLAGAIALVIVAACSDAADQANRNAQGESARIQANAVATQVAPTMPPIPDSIANKLQMGIEARDSQTIAQPVRLARAAGASARSDSDTSSLFTSKLLARVGVVTPVASVDTLRIKHFKKAEQDNAPVLIANLYLSEALDAFPAGNSSIFLHYDDGKKSWYATINEFDGPKLNVTRYVYRAHDQVSELNKPEDYPETARFDWSEDAMSKLLVGVPCDLGWCMIGTTKTETDILDPFDTMTVVVDATYRVRGWYDRKFSLKTGKWAYVFPEKDIAKKIEKNFKLNAIRLASISAEGISGYTRVHVTDDANDPKKQDWQALVTGRAATMKRVPGKAGKMPGAARWGSGLYDIQEIGSGPGGTVGKSKVIVLGDMWVRCASGCCQVTIM